MKKNLLGKLTDYNLNTLTFKDYFSSQAIDYKKFRPEYPNELITYIVSLCNDKNTAWDCATGNGQVATLLSHFFEKVIATDGSEKQIASAVVKNNIEYRIATAENSFLEPNSVDLITVGQAAHWFHLPDFYKEAKRVAKPNAILALWGYAHHTINAEIDAVVWKLYKDILDAYWPKERALVEQGYKDLYFPFETLETPQFYIQKPINLHDLLGYLITWSATQIYIQQNNQNPIELIYYELLQVWGNEATVRTIQWPVFLKVAKL